MGILSTIARIISLRNRGSAAPAAAARYASPQKVPHSGTPIFLRFRSFRATNKLLAINEKLKNQIKNGHIRTVF